MRALAAPPAPGVSPPSEWLTVVLPCSADRAYELFCDIDRVPEWLLVLRSAHVTRRYTDGRPREVAFLARLQRATVGYTCTYRYHRSTRRVSWSTRADCSIQVSGAAQFAPLGDGACLMTYTLRLDLGDTGLAGWADPLFDGHAQSATMADFRDYVSRQPSA